MTLTVDQQLALLPTLEALAREAGALILSVYARDFATRSKADASPVTEADERAEALIVAALRRLAPDIPIVAEEEVARGARPEVGDEFWLVDPLDGTREFISRNGEFTVNIALVQAGEAVLGVVLAPAIERMYSGVVGAGAWVSDMNDMSDTTEMTDAGDVGGAPGRRAIRARATPATGLTVVSSRSHGDAEALQALLAGQRVAEQRTAGSSLKFGLIAEGQADLYPRLGRTMEWDTAAGHAVLAAAGGQVTDLDGRPLRYGKPGFENPHFLARGRG